MVKRKLLYMVLLVAALCLPFTYAGAQSGNAGAVYTRPTELRLQATARRAFSGYRKEFGGQQFYTEGFYPIGWSRNGNFAYYSEPVDEACGCYFAKLFIMDLKSDKVLWKFEHQGDSTDEDRKAGKPYDINTLWRANRKMFSQKLREYGIEPGGRFALLTFPSGLGGDLLTVDLKTKEKPGLKDDMRIYGAVGQLQLELNSKRNGRKKVLDFTYTTEGLPLYVGTVGYIKSPYEQRIAIILLEIIRGYEGPPNVGTVWIVGASLSTGFK